MGLSDIFEYPLNLMVDYHKFPTELSILCRLFNRYPHENPQISLESDGKSIP